MFARMSTIQATPQKVDEAVRMFKEQTIPEAKGISGFKGAYLMVDRKTGKIRSVTLWETEQALKESTEAANRLRSQFTQTVAASGQPEVETFEVAVQPTVPVS